MKKGIIGKKIGMTQIFDENGNVIPVTVVEAGPCVVAQKKTTENSASRSTSRSSASMTAPATTWAMSLQSIPSPQATRSTLRV